MKILNLLTAISLLIVPPTLETVPSFTDYCYYDVDLEAEIQEYITDECIRQFGSSFLGAYNLPRLVINIIRWESGFDADNDNGKCCGLMSVTYSLSDALIEAEEIDDLLNPQQNIRAGIHILKNKYDEIVETADEYTDTQIIAFILESYHTGLDLEKFKPHKCYKYVENVLESYDGTEICIDID